MVMPAAARSASNWTLSPTLTCLSIDGSWTRNTIVIPSSSMSRFLMGPCLRVILPAASSIFFTSPLQSSVFSLDFLS